jgi:hypothetical protein
VQNNLPSKLGYNIQTTKINSKPKKTMNNANQRYNYNKGDSSRNMSKHGKHKKCKNPSPLFP